MQGWEAKSELKMKVEPGFKVSSKDLHQWPQELEKGVTREMLKVNQVGMRNQLRLPNMVCLGIPHKCLTLLICIGFGTFWRERQKQ